ncbi:MAG TPA: hypothetical protein VFL93_07510 [Longimicrobiaceae bacterium]|nr:hypothetical protein [Longimicrobiaceae bacterium]
MSEPVVLSWSGGKDSALALRELRGAGTHDVVGLLTTVTRDHDRVSMHGVRRALLEAQARAARLPLHVVEISAGAGNDEYAESMSRMLEGFRASGVHTVAFGDLFLGDVRRYREEMLAPVGMRAIFPLWGRDTAALAREFIAAGFRATLVCVDGEQLDGRFAGRAFDHSLLDELPARVDPCGERGEFHTFVADGPVFSGPVDFTRGETVLRDGRFHFQDLLPAR